MYGDYMEHVWDKLPEHVKTDSKLSSLRRALQSVVAADAYRQSEDKGLVNVGMGRQFAESSDKRAFFRITYPGLPVLRSGHSAYEEIN